MKTTLLSTHLRQLNPQLEKRRTYKLAIVCLLVWTFAIAFIARKETEYRYERERVLWDDSAQWRADSVNLVYRQYSDAGVEVKETPAGITFEF